MPNPLSCTQQKNPGYPILLFLTLFLLVITTFTTVAHAQSRDVCIDEYSRIQAEFDPKDWTFRWGILTPLEQSLLEMGTDRLKRWDERSSQCRFFSYNEDGLHYFKRHLANVKQALALGTDPRMTYKEFSDSERRALILKVEEKYREAYTLWKEITDSPSPKWSTDTRFLWDREFQHFLTYRLKDNARLADHLENMLRRYAASRFDSDFHDNMGFVLSRLNRHTDAQRAFRRAAESYWTENPDKVGTAVFPRGATGYYKSRAAENRVGEYCPGSDNYKNAEDLTVVLERADTCLRGPYLPLNSLPALLLSAGARFNREGNYKRAFDLYDWFWGLEPEPPFISQYHLDQLRFDQKPKGNTLALMSNSANPYSVDRTWTNYLKAMVLGDVSADRVKRLNRALSELETMWKARPDSRRKDAPEWNAIRHQYLMNAMQFMLGQNRKNDARNFVLGQTMNDVLSDAERSAWKIVNARMLAEDGETERALAHLVALDDELRLRSFDMQRREAQWLRAQILVSGSRNGEALVVLDEMFPPDWVNHQVDEANLRMLVLRAELAAKQGESDRLERYVSEIETFFQRNNASCNFCAQLRALDTAGG